MKSILAIIFMLVFAATGTAITDYIECGHNDKTEPIYVLVEGGIIYMLDKDIVSEEVQSVLTKTLSSTIGYPKSG